MNKETILQSLDFKTFYSSELSSFKLNGNNQAMALCPYHEDKKSSLSINLQTGLYFCHACKEKGDVFSFYQKKHKVDFKTALQELARQAGITETKKTIEAVYDYKDAEGNLVFQTVRYNPKDFKQRRPDHDNKGKWIYDLKGIQLIPYNLSEVIKSKYVILVEGEGKAEILRGMGLIASCSPLGAGKWKPEYNRHFKGKKVYIIGDNDKAGRDHALQVAKNLKGIAQLVKIIELQGLPEKGDIKEWVAQGGTKEKLIEIIKGTSEWEEPQEMKEPDLLSSLLKWNDILSLDVKTEYLLDRLIPKGSITLLFGRGGIGKTSLCLQIARAIAEGLHYGDLQTLKTPAYYIDFENPLSVLKQRVECIGNTDNVYVWHISGNPQPPRLDTKEWELYRQLPAGLLIFDTLRASHLSDENDSQDMAVVIARLKELREAGFTILLLHHTPKGNEGIYKGSTALLDLVDHVLSIESVKNTEDEPIEFDRDNLYRLGVRIKTRYEPHHIFLKFNPEVKGFEIAKDPDMERIEAIYEILKESPEGLKQKDLKEKAKSELDLTESQVRKLLKKGEGMAWDIQKGGEKNRALIYIPKSNWLIGQPIYSHPINQLNTETDKSLSYNMASDSSQTLDNTELDNRTDSVYPINQLEQCSGCMLTPGQRALCEVKKPCPKGAK